MSYNTTDLSHLFGFSPNVAMQTSSSSPRLRIVSHSFSKQQQNYQAAREADSSTFYKDATPRVEYNTASNDGGCFLSKSRLEITKSRSCRSW